MKIKALKDTTDWKFSKKVLTSKILITDYTCKKLNECELSFHPFFI